MVYDWCMSKPTLDIKVYTDYSWDRTWRGFVIIDDIVHYFTDNEPTFDSKSAAVEYYLEYAKQIYRRSGVTNNLSTQSTKK